MEVRVCSFNILADCYAARSFFPYVLPRHLAFAARKELIKNAIRSIDADILCMQVVGKMLCLHADLFASSYAVPFLLTPLQEVDRWPEHLAYLKEMGYEAHYKQRTGGKLDGCILAFKQVVKHTDR